MTGPRDIDAELEAWAAATDPADPIGLDEVRDRPERGTGHSRRWMAVAAAVLVVVGLTAALVAARDGEPDAAVVTDEGREATGPRLQIVVVSEPSDVMARGPAQVHAFALRPGCPGTPRCPAPDPVAAGPLLGSPMLAVDLAVAPGTYALEHLVQRCPDQVCGPPTSAGLLSAAPTGVDVVCRAAIDVGADARRVVFRVGPGASCSVDTDGPIPALTIPPAWSVRSTLPWSCGAHAWDTGRREGPRDPALQQQAAACFAEAAESGEALELPTSSSAHLSDEDQRQEWWRSGQEGPGGRTIEVLREPGNGDPWQRLWCRSVVANDSQHSVADTQPAGGDGPPPDPTELGTWTELWPAGCTAPEPLALDLPPLEEAAEPDATASGPVTVVLDTADLRPYAEGSAWSWFVQVDGETIAEGALTEAGSVGEDDSAVFLVADDLDLPAGAGMSVGVSSYDCSPMGAGTCRADRMGPGLDALPERGCAAEVPPDRTGGVAEVMVRGDTCSIRWRTDRPDLTVPAEWSLRQPATACVDATATTWASCLEEARGRGRIAEWTVRDDEVRTTYRVTDQGQVEVFRRTGTGSASTWTVQDCGAVSDEEDRATNCRDEVPLER